ncbi:MAG: hypothetical protein IPM54_24905 [Polyangiaceae bacterium]|nr:hypothetical protein [Polyangiaceae bacterium]
MTDIPRFLSPKGFGELLDYHRSTVAQWLPAWRAEGIATGYGKATRIEVARARQWITEHTRPKAAPAMPHVFHTETLQ